MARKIILKEDGLTGSGNAPTGYRYLGYDGTTTSEKFGSTVSAIGGGSTDTTVIVNISSAQIKNMGSSPVQLLPAPGVGKYYDIKQVIFEYTYIAPAYNFLDAGSEGLIVTGGCLQEYYIRNNFLLGTSDIARGADGSAGGQIAGQYSYGSGGLINYNVSIYTNDGFNFTTGNGTIRAIVTYEIRTFGA